MLKVTETVPISTCGPCKWKKVVLKNLPSSIKPLQPIVKTPPKIADLLYTSLEWRRFVAGIKRRRGRYCQRCGSTKRVIGDHIVEVKDGGAPFDPGNIELLCQACHNRKTAQQRARRARGDIEGGGSKV